MSIKKKVKKGILSFIELLLAMILVWSWFDFLVLPLLDKGEEPTEENIAKFTK